VSGAPTEAELAVAALAAALGVRTLGNPEALASFGHRFTHLHATYTPYIVAVDAKGVGGADLTWVEPGAPTDLALPVAQRRLLDRLAERAAVGAE